MFQIIDAAGGRYYVEVAIPVKVRIKEAFVGDISYLFLLGVKRVTYRESCIRRSMMIKGSSMDFQLVVP